MIDKLPVEKDNKSIPQLDTSSAPKLSNAVSGPAKPKKENMLINILMNIVIPTLILTNLSSEQYLGATLGLLLALSFPIAYGLKDYLTQRKFNFFSALGIVSVLLTGGISLLHLPTQYYAIKEAAIPGLIGLIVIISTKTRFPLVKTFLYNENLLRVDKIAAALAERGNSEKFEKTLRNGSYIIAMSFFISSILNYVLAKMIVVSPTGTPEFNVEIGKMHALGFPVIAVPSLIIMVATLMYIFRSIRILADLTLEDVMNDDNNKS